MATPPRDVIDLSSPPSSPSTNDRLRLELEYLQRANGSSGLLPNMFHAVNTMGAAAPVLPLAQRQALLQLQARANSGLAAVEARTRGGDPFSIRNSARSHHSSENFLNHANQHLRNINENEQLQQQVIASTVGNAISQAAQDTASGVSPSAYALRSEHLGYQGSMLANQLSYADSMLGANRNPHPPENMFRYNSSTLANMHDLADLYSRRRRTTHTHAANGSGATAGRSPEVIDLLDDDEDENAEGLREEASKRSKKANDQSRKTTIQAAGISTDERPVIQQAEAIKGKGVGQKGPSHHTDSSRPAPNSASLHSNLTHSSREETTEQRHNIDQELRNNNASRENSCVPAQTVPAAKQKAKNNFPSLPQKQQQPDQSKTGPTQLAAVKPSADVLAAQKIHYNQPRQNTNSIAASVPASVVPKPATKDRMIQLAQQSVNQNSPAIDIAVSGASKLSSNAQQMVSEQNGSLNRTVGSVSNIHTATGAVSQATSLPSIKQKSQNSTALIAEINAKIKECKKAQANHPSEDESVRQWVDRLETAISLLDKAIDLLRCKDKEGCGVMTCGEDEKIVFRSPDEMCASQIQNHTEDLASLMEKKSIEHKSKLCALEKDSNAFEEETKRPCQTKEHYVEAQQKFYGRCSSLKKDAVNYEKRMYESIEEEFRIKKKKIEEKSEEAQKKINAAEREMTMMSDTFIEGYRESLKRSYENEVEFQQRQIDEVERRLDRLERRHSLAKMWQRKKKKIGDRRSQSRKIYPSDMSAMSMIDVLSNDLYQLEKTADDIRDG